MTEFAGDLKAGSVVDRFLGLPDPGDTGGWLPGDLGIPGTGVAGPKIMEADQTMLMEDRNGDGMEVGIEVDPAHIGGNDIPPIPLFINGLAEKLRRSGRDRHPPFPFVPPATLGAFGNADAAALFRMPPRSV